MTPLRSAIAHINAFLAKVEETDAARTPGPWETERGNKGSEHPLFLIVPGDRGGRLVGSDEDAAYVALAVNSLAATARLAKVLIADAPHWDEACWWPEVAAIIRFAERAHRFIEESLELVQARGLSREDVLMLVDYVYDRPKGEDTQEVGGVLLTLAALCFAADINMQKCGEDELDRVWKNIEKIRAKQAAKPRGPLPQAAESAYARAREEGERAERERHQWRPIAEMHEDHGPCVVMDIDDPGRLEIGHVCDIERDWEEWATHFAPVPPLTSEQADSLAAAIRAGKEGKE